MIRLVQCLAWWALDYAYAAHWQIRATFNRTDPGIFTTGDNRPLVIIPGIYETWKFMQPLIEQLHAHGHPVHVITELDDNRSPIAEATDHVARYLEAHHLSDVVIVAHSKGGLIGKQVMATSPAATWVRSMIAVATPFAGSRYGSLMWTRSLRAFSPRDPAILALHDLADVNARIVSIYPRFDPHIPGGSHLPGADNITLDMGGHFRILAQPRVVTEILQAAADPAV